MSMTVTHIAKWSGATMLGQQLIAMAFGGTITIAAWVIGAGVGVLGGWNDIAAFPDHLRAMWKAKSWSARDYTGMYQRWHVGGDLFNKFSWLIPIREHGEADYPMHNELGWRRGARWQEASFVLLSVLTWIMFLIVKR